MKTEEYRPFPIFQTRNFLQARIEVPLFIRALRLPRNARILEVGCGPGVALSVLKSSLEPRLLVGIDNDESMVKAASATSEAAGAPVYCAVADLRKLPFPDCSFDLILDFGTCYHISRQEEALAEISRVLDRGGIFAVEGRLSQLISHPFRSRGGSLEWKRGNFRPRLHAGLWMSLAKI